VLLGLDVGVEVGETDVTVPVFHERRPDVVQLGGGVTGEGSVPEIVDHSGELGVGAVELPRPMGAGGEARLHLLGGEAEDEDVVVTDDILDFDVGAVEGADGERAVEGHLHVAGAGGLHPGGLRSARRDRRRG